LKIDILTLFPDSVSHVLGESIIGRGAKKGLLEINCVQIRDFTENKQCQVDDYPYGGGWGCVMMAQPLKSSLDSVMGKAARDRTRVIYMSPQGKPYNQEEAKRLVRDYDHLVLVCGHYEGIDERFIEECVDEEISLGDFVLTGGEIAAMAVADSVCRMVPGVLADEECFTGESHWDGLLEYPQYTRPDVWEGRAIPEILTSGNHADVERWRRKKCLERTMDKRPDMFEAFEIRDKRDAELIEEIKKERAPKEPPFVIDCRRAEEADIPALVQIADEARAFLKGNGVDQWQNGYPVAADFLADIKAGNGWVFTVNGEVGGYIYITTKPEACYAGITEGAWTDMDAVYGTFHRSMVRAKFRGSRLAREMLAFAAELTEGMGLAYLRGDTHRDNIPMQKLLKKCGFEYKGIVHLDSPSEMGAERLAFEKNLYGE